MPITLGCPVSAATASGVGTGARAAFCGWTPTVHQTAGCASARVRMASDCCMEVPMVTSSPTPAAAARDSTASSSSGK